MFYHDKKDEITTRVEMVSGDKPGSPAFLGALQDVITHFWKMLSDEEIARYQATAKDWSLNGPPSHVQAR